MTPSRLRAIVSAVLWAALLCACASPARAQWPANGRGVCTATGDQSYPAVAPDGTGGAIVAWEDRRGAASDIYAGRVGANGALTASWPSGGRALCTATQEQVAPVIIADGAGGAFVAWEDYRAGGANPDIYVQRVTAAGALASGWPANGVGVCTLGSVQGRPSLVSDGAGGAFVTWEDFRNGASDVYAQRVTAAGLAQWATNGVALCAAAGAQRFPLAVPDGAGGAIVAWEDARGDGDVYARRVNSAGVPQWTGDGVAVCAAEGDQFAVRVAGDGAGGVVLSWEDHRAENSDVYAQRLGPDGEPVWTPDGIAMCCEASEQYGAVIAADGAGGAFVAWVDLRSGTSDIFAQHATPGGTVASGWALDGNPICDVAGHQFDPVIGGDGSGGVYVAWDDTRPGTNQSDVYALRVTGSGGLAGGWGAGGTSFCSATGDQIVTSLQPDGAGGALVAWSDQRGADADIYALRIASSGGVPTVDVPDAHATGALRLSVAPNPISSPAQLRFSLETAGPVAVRIVDPLGRRVRTLLADVTLPAGAHQIAWDGLDDERRRVPAGVYLAVLTAGSRARMEKLAVVR